MSSARNAVFRRLRGRLQGYVTLLLGARVHRCGPINFQAEPLVLHLTLARSSRVQRFKVANWASQPRRLKV